MTYESDPLWKRRDSITIPMDMYRDFMFKASVADSLAKEIFNLRKILDAEDGRSLYGVVSRLLAKQI